MSFSENIKKYRTEKGLTQEQLASRLGISGQAVSKWETSETYPDGSLLAPLADELDVSLDELFDRRRVSMSDISDKIIRLFANTEQKDRFNIARDIGWQMEKGLFNPNPAAYGKYSPDEIKNLKNDSCVVGDFGFTIISNGSEPFFSLFPRPENGFGDFAEDIGKLKEIFASLSSENVINALLFVISKMPNFVFEPAYLARECGISEEETDKVIDALVCLKIVCRDRAEIDGERHMICYSNSGYKLIALFLIARTLLYTGPYSMMSKHITKPMINLR